MKTKLLLAVALIGAASLSAQAGVHLNISLGLPLPVVVTAPAAPVVVAPPPPPVIVTAPVVVAPPVVVAAPPCPDPGYVWVAGYWTTSHYQRVWIPARWQYRPAHVVYYGHAYGPDRAWHHR